MKGTSMYQFSTLRFVFQIQEQLLEQDFGPPGITSATKLACSIIHVRTLASAWLRVTSLENPAASITFCGLVAHTLLQTLVLSVLAFFPSLDITLLIPLLQHITFNPIEPPLHHRNLNQFTSLDMASNDEDMTDVVDEQPTAKDSVSKLTLRPADSSHPPMYSKPPKTSMRPKKVPKSRAKLTVDTFANPNETAAEPPLTPSTYAFASHGEKTVLFGGPSAGETAGKDAEKTLSSAEESAQNTMDESPPAVGKEIKERPADDDDDDRSDDGIEEYSNEARMYHARYAELSSFHDFARYAECLEGCKDLLTEPRIPLWTRIQTLQMMSTIVAPVIAEDCLEDASHVLGMLNPNDFRTKLLREDNNNMIADINVWRQKQGLVGKDISGELGEDRPPVAGYFQLDHDMLEREQEEFEEEAEPFGKKPPAAASKEPSKPVSEGASTEASIVQGADDEDTKMTGIMSPNESEEEL
nr:hypothetical protein B0A51_10608 [Rachicladosporium sp. CCFEE 5018]